MTIASPFPRRSVPSLHAWLNQPREAHFAPGEESDYGAVLALLDQKNAAGQTFAALLDEGHGEKPIGFIGFTPELPDAGRFCGMVIAPEYRGRGHGKRFLSLVVAVLRAQGFTHTYALLDPANHAIRATFAAAGALERIF